MPSPSPSYLRAARHAVVPVGGLKPGRLGLRARSGVIGLHLAGSVAQLAVPGERGDAVAERVGSVENQVLALALRFLQKRADDPAADAVTLTAGWISMRDK